MIRRTPLAPRSGGRSTSPRPSLRRLLPVAVAGAALALSACQTQSPIQTDVTYVAGRRRARRPRRRPGARPRRRQRRQGQGRRAVGVGQQQQRRRRSGSRSRSRRPSRCMPRPRPTPSVGCRAPPRSSSRPSRVNAGRRRHAERAVAERARRPGRRARCCRPAATTRPSRRPLRRRRPPPTATP